MYKSTFQRVLCLVCIFVCIATKPCIASVSLHWENRGIITRMTNINDARCSLTVKNGRVYSVVEVTGKVGAEKCEITLHLQVQNGDEWITVESWNEVETGRNASINKSITAQKGKTYRAQTVVTVWLDGISESQTITTNSKTA